MIAPMNLLLCVLATVIAETGGSQPAAVFPGEQWREASPESQGVDVDKLKAAVAYMDSHFGPDGARELVIVRRGFLIWQGPDIDAYHNVWSCTKTFASSVLGLLIADGKCGLDDLAVTYLPSLDDRHPVYSTIALRHMASMSSGYKGQLVDITAQQPWGDPMWYLEPAEPLFEPGTRVQYHDHQVFVLGAILTHLAGEPLKALFKRRIADPIGLTKWDWGVSGQVDGIELNNAAGTPSKAQGIQMTARQMARYGLLYLHRGRWNDRQLLPTPFVEQATCNQVPGAGASSFLHKRYGLYWWTNDVMPTGKRPWPTAPPRTYTAHGHGCNFCFVIPEWSMVVVRMGTSPIGTIAEQDVMWNAFFTRLADAMTSGQP
ncbi:MAG: serine hydrolase [Sedimentisphaerales bacterium]|nr:serine hydrolase [Sedimentisphaerales bacterium]